MPEALRRPLVMIAAVAGAGAVALGCAVAGDSSPGRLDNTIDALVAPLQATDGPATSAFVDLGDAVPAALLILALSYLAWRTVSAPAAWALLLGCVSTGAATVLAKPLVGRTIHDLSNLCYPSGHTAALTTIGLSAGLLLVRVRAIESGPVLLTVGAASFVPGLAEAVLLVAYDIHYATDTIGGMLTALAVTPAVMVATDRMTERGGIRLARTNGPEAAAVDRAGRRLCAAHEYPPELLAVAAYGLTGSHHRFPEHPLGAEAWAKLLAAAETNRVTGPLARAAADGALPVTPFQLAQTKASHRSQTLHVLAVEQELIAVQILLDEAGLEHRVLKGCAVATLDYPDQAQRTFVDMDVLVRAADIDRVVATLSAAGYRRTLAEPRPGFDRRFDKGMTLMTPGGLELDLHRTFVLGPWGRCVDLDELWRDSVEFSVAGRPARALTRPNRFMHACYHAALGNWPLRLGSLRDVIEILRRIEDEEELRDLAGSWGAEAVVAAAVSDAHRLLGISHAGGSVRRWADEFQPSRRDIRWLRLHTHSGKTFTAQAVATLRTLPRMRDRIAYVHALILPLPAYTADRHRSPVSRLRYAVREVRQGRG